MKNNSTSFYFLIALIFGISLTTFSQDYSGIKKGDVVKLEGTNYGLVKHKKKTGLYDFTKEKFIVSPEKSYFHYYKNSHFLFILDKQDIVSLYNLNEAVNACFVVSNKYELTLEMIHDEHLSIGLPHDTTVASTIPDSLILNGTFTYPMMGLRKLENSLIIFHYEPRIMDPNPAPLASRMFPFLDSLIYDPLYEREVEVYPSDIPAVYNAGVKSLKTGEWQIEPKYDNIFFDHNYFLCAYNAPTNGNPHVHYDIYRKEEDVILPTKYMGLKYNYQLPNSLFSPYKLEHDKDSTFFHTYSEEGMGLMTLFLFDSRYQNDYSYWYQGFWNFQNKTFFEPRYEFTHRIDPEFKFLIAYADDEFELIRSRGTYQVRGDFDNFPLPIHQSLELYNNIEAYQEYYVVDGVSYIDTCDEGLCMKKIATPILSTGNYLGIEKIGDSLIYVKYHLPEELDPFAIPLKSWTYKGEDSIRFDPKTGYYETVYPPNDPGVYESGIYDLRTKKWGIEPINAWVLKTYEGFLISKPLLDEDFRILRYEYSFKNNDGTYLFENIQEEELRENLAYKKLFVPDFKVDELYPYNVQYSEHWYAFISGKKTGLVDLNKMEVLHPPSEYIYHHQESQSFVSIDTGLLHIENDWSDTTFDLNNCIKLKGTLGFHGLAIQSETATKTTYSVFTDHNYNVHEFAAGEKPNSEALIKKEENGEEIGFQLSRINDSLIYIEDWVKNYVADYPIQSWEYPDEDSIIYDSRTSTYEVIYLPDIAGYSRSGIYDYMNGKWFIPAENRIITPYNNEYVLLVPVVNEFEIIIRYKFTIVNALGVTILKEKTFPELPVEYQAFLMIRPEIKSIFNYFEELKKLQN